MAVHARFTRILVDEFDFSTDSNSLTVALASNPIDVTCFQASALDWLQGFAGGTIAHNGYYIVGAAEGELEKEMYDRRETPADVVTAMFGTDTQACPSYVIPQTYADQWEVDAPIEDALTLTGNWNGGGGIKRGLRVWTGTFSATGVQTSPAFIDLGALGTAGGFAYLHIQAITGGATDAIILLESDDNTGFTSAATEATWTFSAVGAEEKVLSATVDRYVRLNCTDLGTATDFTVVAIVCTSGVTF